MKQHHIFQVLFITLFACLLNQIRGQENNSFLDDRNLSFLIYSIDEMKFYTLDPVNLNRMVIADFSSTDYHIRNNLTILSDQYLYLIYGMIPRLGVIPDDQVASVIQVNLETYEQIIVYQGINLFRLFPHPDPDIVIVQYFPEGEEPGPYANSELCILRIDSGICDDLPAIIGDRYLISNTVHWLDEHRFMAFGRTWLDLVNIEEGTITNLLEMVNVISGTPIFVNESFLLFGDPLDDEDSTPMLYIFDMYNMSYELIEYELDDGIYPRYIFVSKENQTLLHDNGSTQCGYTLIDFETGNHIAEYLDVDTVYWLPDNREFLTLRLPKSFCNESDLGDISRVNATTGEEIVWLTFDDDIRLIIVENHD